MNLFFFGAVAGAVLLDGGNVEFAAASDATVTFGASGGTLKIDDATIFGSQITGFRPGSLIDFGGFDDANMSHAHVYYDSDTGEVFFFHSVDEAPPDYVMDVGVVSTSVNHVLSDADFALLPDGTGGYSLAFNDFWIGGNGAAIDDPDNWSLGYVPDLNTAVTYNDSETPAYLDLGEGVFLIAGLILGTGVEVIIVNGILDIGALDNSGTLTIGNGIGGDYTAVHLSQPSINQAGGSMTVTGNAGLYIDSDFDNYGTFEANQGAQVYADGDITNEAGGIFNVLDGASLTMVGTFTNYGTALVDPAVLEVQGDVHNTGTIEAGLDGVFHATGYVEGSGDFLITGGSMEFGGGVDGNVTITFGESTSDKLILDHSNEFAGKLSGFGTGDEIVDRDGVLANSFTVEVTDTGVVLHYTEDCNDVSLNLSGCYSNNNFAVSYSGGGIDISYNLPPEITAPATLATNEDTPLVLSGATISLVDSDTGELTVTLSADYGAISLNQVAGLLFSNGDGTAGTSMTFSGTQAAINQALGGLTFAPDANYDGNAAAITVAASDGAGDPVEHVIDITINPVNDAPELTGTLAADIGLGGSHTLTTTELNFTDPDDIASGVTFSVSNLDHGSVYVNGSVSNSFTGQQLAAGLVSFLHNGSGEADAGFSVSVEDGNEDGSTPIADAFHFVVGPTRDFEANLQGWSVVGAVNTTTAEHFDGASSANLASAVAQTVVAASQIESFLDTGSGALAGLGIGTPFAGSAMKATFYLNEGDAFSFDWKFQTHDYLPYNDFAFFSVANGVTTELADVASLENTNGNVSSTTWHEASFFAPESGQYTFGFGVIDVLDSNVQSNLYIDHIQIATGSPT